MDDTGGTLLSVEQVAERLNLGHRAVRNIPPADLPFLQRTPNARRKYRPIDVALYVEKYTRRS